MDMIKRLIIFLLVTVGVFSTVEFISYKLETANDWGVKTTVHSSKDKTVRQTANVKASHGQARRKNRTSNL
jgi:hypothetical protein